MLQIGSPETSIKKTSVEKTANDKRLKHKHGFAPKIPIYRQQRIFEKHRDKFFINGKLAASKSKIYLDVARKYGITDKQTVCIRENSNFIFALHIFLNVVIITGIYVCEAVFQKRSKTQNIF